jgi:glycosyltransferase involved in cell wall biosynthesis
MTRNNPLVSIVFATHNSEHSIEECLRCLNKQKYKNIELIIVDDCSTDSTNEIIKKNSYKFKKYHYIHNDNKLGEAKSLNKAIRKANGELIYFIASDIYVKKNALYEAVNYIKNKPHDTIALMGSIYNVDKGYWSELRHLLMLGGFQKKNIRELNTFALNNLLIKREIFDKEGNLLSTSRCADVHFSSKLKLKGYRFFYFPKLEVLHDHPLNNVIDYINFIKKSTQGYIYIRTENTKIHYNLIKNKTLFFAIFPSLPFLSTLKKIMNGNQKNIICRLPLFIIPLLIGQIYFWILVAKYLLRKDN